MNARQEPETTVEPRQPSKRTGAHNRLNIEPIPQADDADIAEQARLVDDDGEDDEPPGDLGASGNADLGDLLEQRLAVGDGPAAE
jgi:hypothetical protein